MALVITVPLVDDPALDPVSELSDPGTEFTVASPASYATWGAMFTAADSANADTINLGPGDYEAAWGIMPTTLSISNGTAERRRVLRYVSSTPPWKRDSNDVAVIGQLSFFDDSHWIVSGLTPKSVAVVWVDGSHITFHENHWSNAGGYCVRMLGSDNTVQRTFFDTQDSQGDDAPSVHIEPSQVQSATLPSNNKILDNEIKDWNDGIGFTADKSEGIEANYIDGTIVRGNDIYLTPAKYLYENGGEYADAENAFDFKVGASDPAAPVIVANNRAWGFRFVAPSLQAGGKNANGALVTNHVYSQNLLFENNICGDSPIGWIEHQWRGELPYNPPGPSGIATPRGTILSGNVWYNIRPFSPSDISSGVYRTSTRIAVDGDRILGARSLSSKQVGLPEFGDNSVDNVTAHGLHSLGEFATYWDDGDANTYDKIILRYQRKRLSGPEWVTIEMGSARRNSKFRTGLK